VNCIHWLSPGDPNQRTGGYLYNARIGEALRGMGLMVEVVELDSPWPVGGESHAERLDAIPDDATVVADGLLWPGLLGEERAALCQRTRVWVVVHSLMDMEGATQLAMLESMALNEAHGCFATSARTAGLVAERTERDSVPVVEPGTESTSTAEGPGTNALLAVGHVIPRKGYRQLLTALAELKDVEWTLDIVGSLTRDPEHATEIQAVVIACGLAGRVRFLGELGQADLEAAYAGADCLVHAAHFEAYGMVLTEALQRGVPVLSTPAGALDAVDSAGVGMLDPADMVEGLREWLVEPLRLKQARTAALNMRFPTWADQASLLAGLMGFEEHGFSVEWLNMREPYDHGCRSVPLVEQLSRFLGEGPLRIMELGAGLGSGARFVAGHLGSDVEWTLVDRDPRLLREAANRLPCTSVQLDVHDLDALPTEVSAVTLQALLDLVSDEWLVAFADWLSQRKLPLLAALTVDGRVSWEPAHPADADVARAFQFHQTWDRGFGASVGVAAAPRLAELLTERGYRVEMRSADWDIPATAEAMVSAMVDGTQHAAQEAASAAGIDPSVVEAWAQDRRSEAGALRLTVGHQDLLALPPA